MQEETLNLNYWKYLEKHQWKLIQLNGVFLNNADNLMVNFNLAEMTFSGALGLSVFNGKLDSKGEKISFSNVESRKAEDISPGEGEGKKKIMEDFLNILYQKDLNFDVADQTLNIYKNGKIILMFGRTC